MDESNRSTPANIDKSKMEKLVREVYQLKRRWDQLTGEGDETLPGPPATDEQIRGVEAFCQHTLPTSYRLFLSIHNGWQYWSGDTALLSTQQMVSGEYPDLIRKWKQRERRLNSTLIDNCLVIGFSPDEGAPVLIDYSSASKDIVIWGDHEEENRYSDFFEFLEGDREALKELIELEQGSR